jgi:hypothetical protein
MVQPQETRTEPAMQNTETLPRSEPLLGHHPILSCNIFKDRKFATINDVASPFPCASPINSIKTLVAHTKLFDAQRVLGKPG